MRRLLAERKYAEAAKLVGAKVMSKPLAQMPYQTVGDLALTFPEVDVGRELPARSRSDDGDGARVLHQRRRDVLARGVRERTRPGHRRAADRQPSRPDLFEARMQTPQRATVEATADGDLVMRGVNGDGAGAHRRRSSDDRRPALRGPRPRRSPTGGTRRTSGDAVVVRDADAVTLLIAAATSYRTYRGRRAPIPPRASRRRSIRRRARASTRCAPRTSATTSRCSTASRSTSGRRSACRPTSACVRSPTATIPGWPRSTSSTAATCSSPAPAPVRSRPTCRASGTRA